MYEGEFVRLRHLDDADAEVMLEYWTNELCFVVLFFLNCVNI